MKQEDDWERTLNESTSAGGCLEIAQAAAEARNNDSTPSRRSVMKGALTGLIAVTGLPATGMALASDEAGVVRADDEITERDITDFEPVNGALAAAEDVEITELEGSVRSDVLAMAVTDSDVQAINGAMEVEGVARKEAQAYRASGLLDGERVETLAVQFEYATVDEDTYAALVWTDTEDVGTEGTIVHHIDVSEDGENDHYDFVTYGVVDGNVETETTRVKNFGGCSSVNWNCVFNIAARYTLIVPACVPCAAGKKPYCAACFGASVVAINYANSGCHWCRDATYA